MKEPVPNTYWQSYAQVRREKRQARYTHNTNALYKYTDLFAELRVAVIEVGKILEMRPPEMDRVLFFMASNRWNYEGNDYHGDLHDCLKFIAKRSTIKLKLDI